ncbi:MAG: hypothetical protein IIT54_06985 [Acetobacter sp.]|nr:hypothetical protein [Acetobacter sp.]
MIKTIRRNIRKRLLQEELQRLSEIFGEKFDNDIEVSFNTSQIAEGLMISEEELKEAIEDGHTTHGLFAYVLCHNLNKNKNSSSRKWNVKNDPGEAVLLRYAGFPFPFYVEPQFLLQDRPYFYADVDVDVGKVTFFAENIFDK